MKCLYENELYSYLCLRIIWKINKRGTCVPWGCFKERAAVNCSKAGKICKHSRIGSHRPKHDPKIYGCSTAQQAIGNLSESSRRFGREDDLQEIYSLQFHGSAEEAPSLHVHCPQFITMSKQTNRSAWINLNSTEHRPPSEYNGSWSHTNFLSPVNRTWRFFAGSKESVIVPTLS